MNLSDAAPKSWAEIAQRAPAPEPMQHSGRRQAMEFESFPLCFQHVCLRCGEGDHTAERCLIHKTKSCQYWRSGHCRFDAASCNYAHDEELRKPWIPYCVGVFCGAQGEAIFAGCGGEHWFRDCPFRVCVYCGAHTHHEAECPFKQALPRDQS